MARLNNFIRFLCFNFVEFEVLLPLVCIFSTTLFYLESMLKNYFLLNQLSNLYNCV